MLNARAICLLLDKQLEARAFSRAWAKTGNRIAARMAIIAITTSNSIRVNPPCFRCNRTISYLLLSSDRLEVGCLLRPISPEGAASGRVPHPKVSGGQHPPHNRE